MRFGHVLLMVAAIGQVAIATPRDLPESRFLEVNGARLEYLDWGGSGSPLIFLAGGGSTAHIFIDLAPQFSYGHRCLALTRRGSGRSEQTADGYSLDNTVRDIVEVANALDLHQLTLIGHSYGGTEAIRASELYPELISRVILLDTAYDPIPPDAPAAEEKLFAALTGMTTTQQFSSLASLRAWEKRIMRNSWSDAAEADLLENMIAAPDGSVTSRTPAQISAAINGGRAAGLWRITKIPCRALLIFADNPWSDLLRGIRLDPETKSEIRTQGAALHAARLSQIAAFRRDAPLSRIVILKHTDHHCFIQRPARVAAEMKAFLRDYPIEH